MGHIFHLQLEKGSESTSNLQVTLKIINKTQQRGGEKSIIRKYKKDREDKHTFLNPKRRGDVIDIPKRPLRVPLGASLSNSTEQSKKSE